MISDPEKPASSRKARRVLVLFVIFALCVGAAWWLGSYRGRALARGEKIIAKMRQTGLPAAWPGPARARWFLISRGGRNVGWQVRFRQPRPKGGFAGGEMRVELSATGPIRLTSRWLLNDQASAGTYLSDVSVLSRSGTVLLRRAMYSARIHLEQSLLDVQQHIHGGKYVSQADEPAGYIPEGTMDVVLGLVARYKTTAKFRMILDSQPPEGDWTRFVVVELAYRDNIKPLSPGGSVVQVTIAKQKQLYFLDKTGLVEKQTSDQSQELAVTRAKVLAEFPDAANMLAEFRQR